MPKIRDIGSIADKWARVTPERSEDYKLGVQNPKTDWKTATQAAVGTYKAAMTTSLTNDRFAKGVSKSSTDKWKEKASTKGANRFGEGVSLGKPDYQVGFSPYRDVIESTSLPPRYPKGDPRNIERVKVLAAALHAKKIG